MNSPTHFLIPEELQYKWLLIDTNFLINASKTPLAYAPIIAKIKSMHSLMVATPMVKVEFLCGANNARQQRTFEKYFNATVESLLPPDATINELALDKLLPTYMGGPRTKSFVTDLFLGATLMKYDDNLMLLTANHKDFPTDIYERVSILHVTDSISITSYAFYKFSRIAYAKTINRSVG